MRIEPRFLLALGTAVILVHCAKGTIGDGEFAGVGGSGGDTTGGTPSSSQSSTSGQSSSSSSSSGIGGATSSDASSSSSSDSSSASNASSSSSSSSSASNSVSSSAMSSSASGPVNCDPTNPSPGCGASKHCLPEPNGTPICAGPTGSGQTCSACASANDCSPAFTCVNTGFSIACLHWCSSDNDCSGGFETCNFLMVPVYVNGTEYGVCYDTFNLPC